MAIKCCNGCEPPKRYPGCGASCPDYAVDKAFDNVEKEVQRQKRWTQAGIDQQKYDGIHRAVKKRPPYKR